MRGKFRNPLVANALKGHWTLKIWNGQKNLQVNVVFGEIVDCGVQQDAVVSVRVKGKLCFFTDSTFLRPTFKARYI